MEVENINSLPSSDFGENFSFPSNDSLELEKSYPYETIVRIVMLSVLLAAALVGNSLVFHTLVTSRSVAQ